MMAEKFYLLAKPAKSFGCAICMSYVCRWNGVLLNRENGNLFSDAEFGKDILKNLV